MIPQIITAGLAIIDKVIPDPEQRDKAKMELLKQQQEGQLGLIEQQLSAIIAEAKSSDPWTSRARPSFLYVIYLLILSAIPMGFLTAYQPETAAAVTSGFKDWLHAIPNEMITLFGVGYLGYVGGRSWDKKLPWRK
jgi:hypothetical protein